MSKLDKTSIPDIRDLAWTRAGELIANTCELMPPWKLQTLMADALRRYGEERVEELEHQIASWEHYSDNHDPHSWYSCRDLNGNRLLTNNPKPKQETVIILEPWVDKPISWLLGELEKQT